MWIKRKTYSEREAYIEGFKDGAKEVLEDSLNEATQSPVKYNGKAVKEMLDYTENMEKKIPEIAEEAANEEKLYSENIQAVVEEAINHTDTMKIGNFTVIEDKSEGDTICLSGGLNGRGIWSNYFEILSKLMFQIELRFPDAYVLKLENDTLDDIFYLTIRIPNDQAVPEEDDQKEFSGDKEPPKQGNKKPGDREIVPKSIVEKVKNGEGVIHKYNGSWRIVSMKTNPPTFWNAKYESKESAESALSAYHTNKRG